MRTALVLGSGGHTAELLKLVSYYVIPSKTSSLRNPQLSCTSFCRICTSCNPGQASSLDPHTYTPRTYYIASTDSLSHDKVVNIHLPPVACPHLSPVPPGPGGGACVR